MYTYCYIIDGRINTLFNHHHHYPHCCQIQKVQLPLFRHPIRLKFRNCSRASSVASGTAILSNHNGSNWPFRKTHPCPSVGLGMFGSATSVSLHIAIWLFALRTCWFRSLLHGGMLPSSMFYQYIFYHLMNYIYQRWECVAVCLWSSLADVRILHISSISSFSLW